MVNKIYVLTGLLGPLIAYASIITCIVLSPWFNWQTNALSDLGHATRSRVAPLFNLGLILAGLCIAIYGATVLIHSAKWTALSLVTSSAALQLVATFDEVYGSTHFMVSVLFFVLLNITSLLYSSERRSRLALLGSIVGISSWVIFWMNVFEVGAAVPEIVSTVSAFTWIVRSTRSGWNDSSGIK